MTPVEQFLRWLLTVSVGDVVKGLILLGLTLYLVFSVVVLRQVGLMRRTVAVENDWWVTILAWAHLVAALGVWVWTWVWV